MKGPRWATKLLLIAACSLLVVVVRRTCGDEPALTWKAGTASAVITPEQPMWMAGYAARDKPSEGKVHDLYAKALALEDSGGKLLVIVTTDLIGIPRALRDRLVEQLRQRHNLPSESLLLNASHTHCGPELRATKASLYDLPPERIEQSRQYLDQLQTRLLDLVHRALADRAPARLQYTHARAGFAMNRRLKTENGFLNRPNPDGPVDHDVPVLRVDSADGKLRAVLFGYACHNTTLGFYKFCGDYAGFAQQYIEQAHPETVAMFMTGCGGDQNPYPRRELIHAEQHGRALANGVEAALGARPREVRGPLSLALEEVTLDFADPPSRERLLREAKSSNRFERRHAELLLKEFEETGKIETTYPYPIQVIRFGDDLLMVALAGEVVVDYSLRFKLELAQAQRPVWVAAYSNDVFGYVPSLRVLQEGGYEAGGAMRYTPLPGPWAPTIEQRIVGKVHELVRQVDRQARGKEQGR